MLLALHGSPELGASADTVGDIKVRAFTTLFASHGLRPLSNGLLWYIVWEWDFGESNG